MALWRFLAYLAGAFFTAGLAVIPQDYCLAVGFVGASAVLGLVTITLYLSTRKRHQKRTEEIAQYIQSGIELTHNAPKTVEEYLIWKSKYSSWHAAVYSWLNRISPTDAVGFVTPRGSEALQYEGFSGPDYQNC